MRATCTRPSARRQGDFFSLHMPLTPNTKGMFNDEAFAKVRSCCVTPLSAAAAPSCR